MPLTPFNTYETPEAILNRIRWAERVFAPMADVLSEKIKGLDVGTTAYERAEIDLANAKYEVEAAKTLREHFGL